MNIAMPKWTLFILGLLACLSYSVARAQTVPFEGDTSTWHEGFVRYDFIMDDSTLAIKPYKAPAGEGFGIGEPPPGTRRCIVIAPRKAAPGNPWSWRGCYWNVEPQTEIALLKRGFFVAYISASATLKPGKEWDAWYRFLTEKHGLSSKPAFIGMSRGGEFEYTWAVRHPDDVCCIYADNPAANQEILMKLGGLALRDVPLLHVAGSIDPLLATNTLAIEQIYQQFGGRISVMIKEGYGHHPHSLRNPTPIADFIEHSSQETKPALPPFAGEQAVAQWFYSDTDIYRYFPDEHAFITYRGPFFNGAYRRYMITIPGVDAFTTVIAPAKPAPGNPWVFRADDIRRDDRVDLALLAKGYYIVTGAVPYNYDGPVLAQWNKIYAYFRGYGFSSKLVMAGNGGAAGPAFGWAIENPGKVSLIYAENPVLKCSQTMTHTQPIDHLSPLAKAGIPILFVCGKDDPSIHADAVDAEKKYRQLGGKITLKLNASGGHILRQSDPEAVLKWIMENTGIRADKRPG